MKEVGQHRVGGQQLAVKVIFYLANEEVGPAGSNLPKLTP